VTNVEKKNGTTNKIEKKIINIFILKHFPAHSFFRIFFDRVKELIFKYKRTDTFYQTVQYLNLQYKVLSICSSGKEKECFFCVISIGKSEHSIYFLDDYL
jgi:hypothetical protein